MSGYSVERTVELLLERGFYSTAYQPILSTSGKDVYGYESLLRGPVETPLESPQRVFNEVGYVSDALRVRLDRASIDSAVRTGRRLPENAKLFINIQARTLEALTGDISPFMDMLDEAGIEPMRLVFEISEHTGKECTGLVRTCVETLRQHGIGIALDDIGIRSPYLYHLLYLNPQYLKLDRIFIGGVDEDPRKQDLIGGMDYLARRMGARLIAEGVETREELHTLERLGVPLLQGYYVGAPSAAERWLKGACHGV